MLLGQFLEFMEVFRDCAGSLQRIATALESSVALEREDPIGLLAAALTDQGGEPPETVPLDESQLSADELVRRLMG